MSALPNIMTCDVEDYFQVSAFEKIIDKDSWSTWECRIPQNVDLILQMMDEAGTLGTFFTLGWVAENHPEVVRRIADAGHEIASHGMLHVRIFDMSATQFRDEVTRSMHLLEDVSGQAVNGFRAASWSFDRRTPWAHAILAEAGYRYSSSVYPISHDHYGVPDAPTRPFYVKDTDILEIPASVTRAFGRNLPSAGGGYFRLMPLSASRWLIQRARVMNESPAIFYFHPWELDPDQPRVAGATAKSRFRHYLNLHRFEGRFRRLLSQFDWGRLDWAFLPELT